MTAALERHMPDPAAMRFQFKDNDENYVDYHWIQQTEGEPVEWQLSHDLTDGTWGAMVDQGCSRQEAAQAQLNALLACLTEDQKAEAAQAARDRQRGWAVVYDTARDCLAIQKMDEMETFATDDEALADARRRAAAGDGDAARCVAAHDGNEAAIDTFLTAA
ncbi:hypothetical protein [Rhizobium sp. RU36D]|uniref:hypothetical protein n=1 Tax=Rhizobium sp. RU36D TaxID=1907415 RepID=UPI0009D8EC13|nr:hypothetical protein [Rhizobium sp. RU36D]SMD16327.1 hypothetical protein SAMN05880593_12943 [Rhizobium sp. RU36D]